MNALLASFLGFLLGAGLCLLGFRLSGRVGLQAIAAGNPEALEAMGTMAKTASWAHAVMLDEQGHTSAAATMVLLTRTARRRPELHLSVTNREKTRLEEKYEAVIEQGNLVFPNPNHVVDCAEHGESRWAGHVQCLRCLRIYVGVESAPTPCACGYRLLPEEVGSLPLPSSGGRVCRHCAADPPEIRPVDPPDPAQQLRPVFEYPVSGLWEWGECQRCGAELYLRFGDVREVLGPPPASCPACGHGARDPDPASDPIPLPPAQAEEDAP